MSAKETGGPAFPHFDKSRQHSSDGYVYYQGIEKGMTLRDYFAAKAMQTLVAGIPDNYDLVEFGCDTHSDEVAVISYKVADAMLKERNK